MVVLRILETFLVSIFILLYAANQANSISIESWRNYQCNDTRCEKSLQNNSAINLIYSKSSGHPSNRSLHYFFSTFGDGERYTGAPAFFMVETSSSAHPNLNWKELLQENSTVAKCISFDEKPTNTIGIIISRIFFWNDTKNTGDLKNDDDVTLTLNWDDFIWADMDNETDISEPIVFKLKPKHKVLNGEFEIHVQISPDSEMYNNLPHLIFNENSMHVEMTMNGIIQNETEAKVAFEVSLVTHNKDASIVRTLTKDDEYSPGVFQIFDYTFKNKHNTDITNDSSSFIQWKPVAYTSSQRIIAKTLDIMDNKIQGRGEEYLKENKALYGFYSGLSNDSYTVHTLNFTFGSAKEKYYDNTNYVTWSFVTGIGTAPEHSLSTIVTIIILVGFGLPVTAMLVSVIYFIVAKCRRRKSSDNFLIPQDD